MPRQGGAQRGYRARPRQPRSGSTTIIRSTSTQATFSGTVTNAGTVPVAPVVSKTGVTGPTAVFFENVTAGKRVTVNVPAGTGTLSVDFSTRTVTFAGSTVTDAVTTDSRWWELAAGANTVRSSIAATVTHRDGFS